MNIDPYKVLRVEKSASPIEIKKSYKKLSLKFHPDKIQQLKSEEDKDFFPKLQFAYSILSDVNKRRLYDNTGSLGLSEDDIDGGFDWKEYFQSTSEKITIEMIEEDKLKYENSAEEREDILHNFVYYEGDFLRLFEVIPHLEFNEAQESRIFSIVEGAVDSKEIDSDSALLKTWERYKRSRKTKVKQVLKKMAKEAREAEKLANVIGKKNTSTENDLRAMIQKKNSGRMDHLISSLEAKYGKPKGRKRSLPDDDEFEKVQQKMMKQRR